MWWIVHNCLELDKFEEMIFQYNAFTITFDVDCCRITFRIPKKENCLFGVHAVLLSCHATIVCLESITTVSNVLDRSLLFQLENVNLLFLTEKRSVVWIG